ncbi:MAG: tRNA (adenosine(37)-N6)-threonylcarbamoyltransferase complex dimerization subunit type 1 TsaB [Oscillospiraceae bacterium]
MKILAIDTSAKVASVSIVSQDEVIAEFNINCKLTHSQTLMPMCEQILSQTNLKIEDLDAFAVSVGPGSYTGLRIGISAVKGLALATNKPCIAVSTLHALALNVSLFDGVICAVMDARCNQVYCALFNSNANELQRITNDEAIPIDELEVKLKTFQKNIILVGDGALLCYNSLSDKISNLSLSPKSQMLQKASSVGLLGVSAYNNGQTLTCDELMPLYLRLPQAQREREAKLCNKD